MERKSASDYPQELLDLFHEYQHGRIDRRTFLDRAGKFAVGGLTVAAIFEGLRPNYAWAQQVAPDDKRIKTGYAPGIYQLSFTVGADPYVYTTQFQVR